MTSFDKPNSNADRNSSYALEKLAYGGPFFESYNSVSRCAKSSCEGLAKAIKESLDNPRFGYETRELLANQTSAHENKNLAPTKTAKP